MMLVALSAGLISAAWAAASPASSSVQTWSIAKSPRISSAGLSDASCPGANSCFAVGAQAHHGPFGTEETLIEHWNGHDWSVMPSPDPNGVRLAGLSGVSCPSTTSCFAVGFADFARTLIEHWNGHDWSIMKSPTPRRQLNDDTWLGGISCPGTNSCFAVGVGGYQADGLVEHWNGHDWSIMKTPKHVGYHSPLRAVSCPSRTSCFAVGTSLTRTSATLIEHWNGTTWGVMSSPNPATSNGLVGVSCPAKTTCFAVGEFTGRIGSGQDVGGAVERPRLGDHEEPQSRSPEPLRSRCRPECREVPRTPTSAWPSAACTGRSPSAGFAAAGGRSPRPRNPPTARRSAGSGAGARPAATG